MKVQQFIFQCMMCDWVCASFNAPTLHLQTLLVMGSRYQWSLDFTNSLSLEPWHSWYVLVMVEHFFKWLELVPLRDYNSEWTKYAFLDRMFSRFGVLIKVFIDQSTKFHTKFQKLCEKALIDHWIISWDRLKADGLIEWMVKMVKWRLCKYGLQKGQTKDWDF